MALKIPINRCCDCGFNEHDQEPYRPGLFKTYLGYTFFSHPMGAGGNPRIVCLYNPEESFRENVRRITHGQYWDFRKPIALFGEPEFAEQLRGFPNWCPLETL
ncbi:hypothetical protein FGU46_03190 [Methanobacterium sp. CWC-01]|uniref:hypothetical protein n=1 Tax=Methanobacterium aridiramus TaxID=2584467 RepID=UPI002575F2D3|nr:hypothetical protein [Methanobacterium sp. CWC-01]WJI09164.1 hypothetical protein FGU46_03190 [Methanobacterium sp. CWC-01]